MNTDDADLNNPQNADTQYTISDASNDKRVPWIRLLNRVREESGGIDLELPIREPGREVEIEE